MLARTDKGEDELKPQSGCLGYQNPFLDSHELAEQLRAFQAVKTDATPDLEPPNHGSSDAQLFSI